MATGDPLSVTIVGGAVLSDSGFSPNCNGWVAAVKFEGMGRRDPINDPVAIATPLVLTVTYPGFDGIESPATRTIAVNGTLPLRNTWPKAWTTATVVGARTWISNGLNQYYTTAGGTTGATAPTHTSGTVSDGGVSWTFQASGTVSGYIEKIVGSDVEVYYALDFPIFQSSECTITAAAFNAAAAYQSSYDPTGAPVSRVSSLARASIPSVTNNSTLSLAGLPPACTFLTPPHQRFTGSLTPEIVVKHPLAGVVSGKVGAVAGVRATAWDFARTTSATASVTAPALSTLITTSSPGNAAVECYRPTLNTSGIAAGDSFVEIEVYPWIGLKWQSQINGEAADWQASRNYPYAGLICRNDGGKLYNVVSITTGLSAGSGGPTGTGAGIVDGGVTWDYLGADLTKQNSRNIPARWHFYNDPSSAYVTLHAHVNETGANIGTPVATHTTYAASRAAFLAGNSFGTIQLAGAALQAATGRTDAGGCSIWLTGNTTGHSGFGASMSGLNVPSVWLYVLADPAVSGVKFAEAGANKVCSRRMWFGEGISMTATSNANNTFFNPGTDNSTTLAQPGTELLISNCTVVGFAGTTPLVGQCGLTWYLNNTISGAFYTGNENIRAHAAMVAGNAISGQILIRQSTIIGNSTTGNTPASTNSVQDTRASAGQVPPMFYIVSDNYVHGLSTNSGGRLIRLFAGGAGVDWARLGTSLDGNILEVTATAPADKCAEVAADTSTQSMTWIDAQNVTRGYMSNMYNTSVGARFNGPYNDQSATTLSALWFELGNISLTRNMIEGSDDHASSGRNGARCQQWWSDNRVGYRYNVNFNGSETGTAFGPGTACGQRDGISSKWNIVPVFANVKNQFINDRSASGTQAGGGDYHPAVGAQARGVVAVLARQYARDGNLRGVNGAAGALAAAGEASTGGGVQSRGARSAVRATTLSQVSAAPALEY